MCTINTFYLSGGDASNNLGAGGIVGITFFVVFLLLVAIVTTAFVVQRRTQPPASTAGFVQGLVVNEEGFGNPGYDSIHAGVELEKDDDSSQA